MVSLEEISEHWDKENGHFKIESPTVLGIKEACFAARRDNQRAFRRGFEAGVEYARVRTWLETAISDLEDRIRKVEAANA